jgi:hypothetical protein
VPELLYSVYLAPALTYNTSPPVLTRLIYLIILWRLMRLISRLERKPTQLCRKTSIHRLAQIDWKDKSWNWSCGSSGDQLGFEPNLALRRPLFERIEQESCRAVSHLLGGNIHRGQWRADMGGEIEIDESGNRYVLWYLEGFERKTSFRAVSLIAAN